MLRTLNIDPVSVPKDIQYILASEFCTPTDVIKDNCYTKMSFPFVGEDYEQVDWVRQRKTYILNFYWLIIKLYILNF